VTILSFTLRCSTMTKEEQHQAQFLLFLETIATGVSKSTSAIRELAMATQSATASTRAFADVLSRSPLRRPRR
jgi:hypothetical protein